MGGGGDKQVKKMANVGNCCRVCLFYTKADLELFILKTIYYGKLWVEVVIVRLLLLWIKM